MRKMKKSLWIAVTVIALALLSVTFAFAAEGDCEHENGYSEYVNGCYVFICDDCGLSQCDHSNRDYYVVTKEGQYDICRNCGEIVYVYCEHGEYETSRDDYWDNNLYQVYCDYESCSCGNYFKMGAEHKFDDYDKEQQSFKCGLCKYSVHYMDCLRIRNTVEDNGDDTYSGEWAFLDRETGEPSGEGTWFFDKNGVLSFSGQGEVCIHLVFDKLAKMNDTSETCEYCIKPLYGTDEETGKMIISEHSVEHPSNLLTKKLKKVVLGEGITALLDSWYSMDASNYNFSIEEVVLPDSFNSEWCKYEYGVGSLSLPFATVKLPVGATLPDSEDGSVFIRNIMIDEDSIYYVTDEDGNIYSKDKTVLYRYQGKDKCFTVPATVTEIADLAFYGRSVETVILPSGLKKIGAYAFSNCVSLKNISLPFGLETIGDAAFLGSVIEKINIPSTVKELGNRIFYTCMWLEEIQISEGITEIPEEAFYMCGSLKEMNIPSSVEKIGAEAFLYCVDLKNVVVPASVEEIGEAAFGACNSLTEITVASDGVDLTDTALGIMDMDIGEAMMEFYMSSDYIELYKLYFSGTKEYDEEKYDNVLSVLECTVNQLQKKLAYAEQKAYNDFLDRGYTVSDILTIYCHEGSTTEAYAIEKGIKYVAEVCEHSFGEWVTGEEGKKYKVCSKCGKILEDEGDADITVSGEGRYEVKLIENPESTEYIYIRGLLDGNIIALYDINLLDENGNKVQPDGMVKVSLPLSEDVTYFTVLRINDDGTLTDMKAVREGDSVVFETDHLSYYVILGGENKADTGDNIKCECLCHTLPWLEILMKIFKILTKLLGGPLTFPCDCL